MLAAILLLALGAIAYDLANRPPDIPLALRGRWITDAPAYAGRGIEFTQDAVVFRTGPNPLDLSAHAVQRLSRSGPDDSTTYLLQYRIDRTTVELSFSYAPGPPPTLRLTNLPQVRWVLVAGPTP